MSDTLAGLFRQRQRGQRRPYVNTMASATRSRLLDLPLGDGRTINDAIARVHHNLITVDEP